MSDDGNNSDSHSSDNFSSLSTYVKLHHINGEANSWKRLPHTHWPMLFSLYNMSLYGSYISFLPPVHLSAVIGPETAKQLRHPNEEAKFKEEQNIRSVEGLRTALELNEEDDEEGERFISCTSSQERATFELRLRPQSETVTRALGRKAATRLSFMGRVVGLYRCKHGFTFISSFSRREGD